MIFNFKNTTDAKTLEGHGAEYFAPLENLGGVKILTSLPSGITNNNTMQELIDALEDNSILIVRSVGTPLVPKNYSVLEVIKLRSDYVLAFTKSQYDKFIFVGGIGTNSKWQGWIELNLANYLPLSGGNETAEVSRGNNIPIVFANTTSGAKTSVTGFKNASDGVMGYLGFTSKDTPSYISADKSKVNTLLHTGNMASHVLPLSGGTVGNGSDTAVPLVLTRKNGNYTELGFSGSDGTLGYLGFSSADNPVFENSARNAAYPLLHTGNSAKVHISQTAPSDTTALWVY